jgi:hypothetical protein
LRRARGRGGKVPCVLRHISEANSPSPVNIRDTTIITLTNSSQKVILPKLAFEYLYEYFESTPKSHGSATLHVSKNVKDLEKKVI